jgi:hypothetical protein
MYYLKSLDQYSKKVVSTSDNTGAFITDSGVDQTQQTNFVANINDAKTAAEAYLERSMTSIEWSELVSATAAEATDFQLEEASVMGVILNRVRTNFGNYGKTVSAQLRARNQFESVTGRNTTNFVNGPGSRASSIYGAAVNLLKNVPKTYLYFTSANRNLFFFPGTDTPRPGRDTKNYLNAKAKYKEIGGSLFG